MPSLCTWNPLENHFSYRKGDSRLVRLGNHASDMYLGPTKFEILFHFFLVSHPISQPPIIASGITQSML